MPRLTRPAAAFIAVLLVATSAQAQFVDRFNGDSINKSDNGLDGWMHLTGDGRARMQLESSGSGYAVIRVDATADRRNIWWALIKRAVSRQLDMQRLATPEHELRVEARIRVSYAPRRVNLHVNTQRTTDFHTHLMEFDIPEAGVWHTISMTTHQFPVRADDTVFAQMALMDWGRDTYRVDVDYFRVDVVEAAKAGPDKGHPVPYRPPAADPESFTHSVPVAHDSTIDLNHPGVNLNDWSVVEDGERRYLVAVNGTRYAILRFDLDAYKGKKAARAGLLELTTHSVQRSPQHTGDFGQVRIVEILGGDPDWDQNTVTAESLMAGEPLEHVLNPQMIIDRPPAERRGEKTRFTISRPVLQRLLDGATKGLAVKPLGAIAAAFYASEASPEPGARLYFDIQAP